MAFVRDPCLLDLIIISDARSKAWIILIYETNDYRNKIWSCHNYKRRQNRTPWENFIYVTRRPGKQRSDRNLFIILRHSCVHHSYSSRPLILYIVLVISYSGWNNPTPTRYWMCLTGYPIYWWCCHSWLETAISLDLSVKNLTWQNACKSSPDFWLIWALWTSHKTTQLK